MPPVPNYAGLAGKKSELIRKALDGSGFIAPVSAAGIGALTVAVVGPPATTQLNALPTGWGDLGWLTTDGMQSAASTSASEIQSFGSTSPTRSDITSETKTVTVVCQETKLITLQLFTGVAAGSLVPDATTGELQITEASTPTKQLYRLLTLAKDDGDGGEIYIGAFYPRVSVTAKADFNLGGGDTAIQYGVTFTAEQDSTLGFSRRWLFGGAGFKALKVSMGFTP